MCQETKPQEPEPQKTTPPDTGSPEAAPQDAVPRDTGPRDASEQKKVVFGFVLKLAVVLLAVWAIFTFVFGVRQVSGETMYPMLRDGDLIVYYRLEGSYQIDDVVAFQLEDEKYQARIVAQGGDVVDLTDDGQLVVNGNVKDEDTIFYETWARVFSDVTFPYTVEEGSYFVLSDYRVAGYDSRSFGAVPQKDLDGKVITVIRRRGI